MENSIAESKFIKPHYIEILDEEGLTAHEIAICLSVPVNRVHRRLERTFIEQVKDILHWKILQTSVKQEIHEVNGYRYDREIDTYALNTRAAKAFVATYKNFIGASYLDFLFDCEFLATEKMPKLIAEIDLLRQKLELSESNHVKRDKRLLRAVKKGMILAPIYRQGEIFTSQLELKWEMRQKETLDEVTRLRAELIHLQNITIGASISAGEKAKQLIQAELEEKNKRIHLAIN